MGVRVPRSLAPRQGRALHPRRELHGLVLVERVRQGRPDHLGEPGRRLPADGPGAPEPRAARVPARRVVLLVHVLARPAQAPVHAREPARTLAGGTRRRERPRDGVRADRGRRRLPGGARPRRVRPLQLGGGDRADRRGDRAHDPRARPGPGGRVHADPRHVTGVVHLRDALPVADRRAHDDVLRLVRRPPARVAADVRRSDRRAGVGGLVGRELHDRVGHQPADHAHPGRPLHDRGALPRPEGRRRLTRLQRPRQVRRRLAARAAGHGRGPRDGDGARAAQGVLGRPPHTPLRGLRQALHGPAAARLPRRTRGRHLRARPLHAGVRPRRDERERRLEAGPARRDHQPARGPERFGRLPLRRGGQGPLEPPAGRHRPGPDPPRPRRGGRGRSSRASTPAARAARRCAAASPPPGWPAGSSPPCWT